MHRLKNITNITSVQFLKYICSSLRIRNMNMEMGSEIHAPIYFDIYLGDASSKYGENLSPGEELLFQALLREENLDKIRRKLSWELPLPMVIDAIHQQFTQYIGTFTFFDTNPKSPKLHTIIDKINNDVVQELHRRQKRSKRASAGSRAVEFETSKIPSTFTLLPRPMFSTNSVEVIL